MVDEPPFIAYNSSVVNINKKGVDGKLHVGYVYRHWIVNDEGVERSYIGITIRKPSERWGKNGVGYKPSNEKAPHKFWRAINKYGWNNFNHEIIGIMESDDKEELINNLKEFERYYIDKYDAFNNGYNSTTGGDSGSLRSEETREKQRVAQIGRVYSEESRKKMSESAKNRPPISEETRRKQSEVRKGVLVGERNPMYGRTGELNPFYGKKHSEASRNKMRAAQKRLKVICITTGEVFNSIREAEREKRAYGIAKVCRGKQKTSGTDAQTGERLEWMFYEDYLKLQEKDDVK